MYSYENYYKVKDEIEKRRLRAREEADARADELRALSPKIREIDEELSGTSMLLFKTACNGGNLSSIKERNKKLVAARRAEIVRLGYPEDYTEVKYFCKACSDTGYIDGTKLCSCLREELIRATIQSSGIGDLIETQSFDNFDLECYNDNPEVYEKMKANLSIAKAYAQSFSKSSGNLLLTGKTGTGKTHISTAIAREVIHKGYDVLYDSIHNILSEFEADKFSPPYSRSEPQSSKYLECDLLIIDDLGTEFSTQFTIACIYNLINTRLNKGLSTIISTNLDSRSLADKYEGRILSRLLSKGTKVLSFVGKDKRIFR